jgi:pyridoxamine 5'-phosphate oxidase family protein
MFSAQEVAYLHSQRLARIATVSARTQPDVAPVGFEFDGTHFYIGGLEMRKTLKYQNVQGNPRVALVVDDLASTTPWTLRGIKVHGRAEIVSRGGQTGPGEYLWITPEKYWSWGIEQPVFQHGQAILKQTEGTTTRRVVLSPPAERSA